VTTPPLPPVVTPPTIDNSDILPTLYPFGNQKSFIKGQISLTANVANISSFLATNIVTPTLGSILKSGEKLNMVALGGGMTAGVRNGGLYRYGQMTAYPNLVAYQMGMVDFQSPLFAENEANGTGYLQLIDDGTPYPSWKEVNNSKAMVKAGNPPELAKYIGTTINNYALPGSGLTEALALSLNPIFGGKWSYEDVLVNRFLDIKTVSLGEYIVKQPINFFMLEDDSDRFTGAIRDNVDVTSFGLEIANLGYASSIDRMIEKLKEKSGATKGVVFTWPSIEDMAYFNWYTMADLKSKAKNISITTTGPQSYQLDANTTKVLFVPTTNVDALFRNLKKGDNVSITLANADMIDPWEYNLNIGGIKTYNNYIRSSAQKAGLAIVDLDDLYHKIHSNTYVSSDGFKIDGSPKGNFFSGDGIYPSALGQAVIANEVIKAINSTYNSNIQLINLNDYSKLVGKE